MKFKEEKIINGYRVVYFEEAKGLGDLVTHILHTGTIGKIVKAVTGHDKPCVGCGKRGNKLNEMFPFKKEKVKDASQFQS